MCGRGGSIMQGLAAGLHGLQTTKPLSRPSLFLRNRLLFVAESTTVRHSKGALVEAEGSRWGGASGRRAGGTGGTYGGQAVERGVYRFISRMPERRVLQHGVERTLLVGPARRTNPRLPPPSPSPVSPPHALQTAFQPQWHVFSYSPSFFP